MSAAIYNTIRQVVSEFGGSEAMANALCDRAGDDIAEAVADQLRQYRDSDPPRALGMTELEASLRWCPMTREIVELGKKANAVGNRFTDRNGSDYANPAGARCIGGYCMSWRWDGAFRGHCGLAGAVTYQPVGEPRRVSNRTPLERPTASEQIDLFDQP